MTAPSEPDLADAATFVAGVPHEWFTWLREHDPVHWTEAGGGFWVVSRYEDVVTVSRDPATFSSWRGTALLADLPQSDLEAMRLQLIHMDPPEHTALRKVVERAFTPRAVAAMREGVARSAREVVDQVIGKGECDFVTDIAAELPLFVLADVLGVPREDRRMLFDWSNRMVGMDDPEYGSADPVEADMSARIAIVEMFQYAHELAETKRRDPGSDITSVLVHAEVDGKRLDDVEFNMFFFLLVVAGNETTRNAISGGARAFLEHREQWDRLVLDPDLLVSATEEVLRWVSPVGQFRRTATRAVELGGRTIAEGEKLVMYYGSANRDPAAFGPSAAKFDVGRDPNHHVAFGFGTHFCLGASLARLEIRTMFDEMRRRLPEFESAGPAERLRSNFINGIKHLPVRFPPAAL